jgi:branched-chain amino acid transport system substrate-binding protein
VRAAARATERLLWNHGGAATGVDWPERANVINVLSPADRYLHGPLEAVRDAHPTAVGVVLLHVDTGFGRAVADGAEASAVRLGFAVSRRAFLPH